MDKIPPHDFESYAAYISRRTREENSKSSIIPKNMEKYYNSDEDHVLEAQQHYDAMEPAEITIDNEQNTMNIDLNLNAYTEFTEYNFEDTEYFNDREFLIEEVTVDERPLKDLLSFEEPLILSQGMKFDNGKPDYSLLPFAAVDEVVKVLTYGAAKYDRFNWEKVQAERYQAASMRHFSAHMQGEKLDPESGINHLAHAVCSLLYLLDFELKKK
jgi:hypothetical protein